MGILFTSFFYVVMGEWEEMDERDKDIKLDVWKYKYENKKR